MSLKEYHRKRKFQQTPEPRGKQEARGAKGKPLRFVVQLHAATRRHFDFRLELDGVLKSWAVPRGPSLNPLDQRLAVMVEDHPIEYGSFEGVIPRGNYGGGTVLLWDRGTYVERGSATRAESEAALRAGLAKGHLTFVLDGEKLRGEFALIQLRRGGEERNWLLVKKRDEFSTYKRIDPAVDRSVATGRTMAEIASGAEAKGEIWIPGRTKRAPKLSPAPRRTAPATPKGAPPKSGMPRRVAPMQPVHARAAESAEGWAYEPYFGLNRAIAEIERGSAKLYSRQFLPFERKYPEIAAALKAWKGAFVLDGEISGGRYRVLDLLYANGEDLRELGLKERLERLRALRLKGALVAVHVARDLKTALREAQRIGAPSVLGRDLASGYRSGISSSWQRIALRKPAAARREEEPALTNLDKIYFPGSGETKGELIAYYRSVAPELVPHLRDRPESMHRHPNGIARPSFFQKDLTGYHPRWLQTTKIYSESVDKTIEFLLCQDTRSLEYMANLGCIELNPWLSRVGSLERPDYSVIDLDPGDRTDFRDVITVAREIHRILERIGLEGYCKTSGATGLHIAIPLGARHDYDASRDFAHAICERIHAEMPEVTSLERNPARRQGKMYLDYLQNRRGQTLAAPYCVRPREGAPVSTPLKWSEVKPGLEPGNFTLRNTRRRLDRVGDLWKPVLLSGAGASLARALKKLEQL